MLDFDPRDRDEDIREIEMPWVESGGREPNRQPEDSRERDGYGERGTRERDTDPRDVFLDGLDLPRGVEREIVVAGDHRYELHGDDSRTLATVRAFRVVGERDLRQTRD